jgi:hypothetical protein
MVPSRRLTIAWMLSSALKPSRDAVAPSGVAVKLPIDFSVLRWDHVA